MPRRDENKLARMHRIATYLVRSPRATHDEIGRETAMGSEAVRHLIQEMRLEGVVSDDYRVHPAFLGFPERYRVDISLSPIQLKDGQGGLPDDRELVSDQKALARYIMRLPDRGEFKGKIYVEDVRILLGHPADLSANVRARDTNSMLDFVTLGIRMCRAVTATSSCQEAWSSREKRLADWLIPVPAPTKDQE